MKLRLTKKKGKQVSSIPVGYWVEGECEVLPKVGERLHLYHPIKTSLNEYFTWFLTTEILHIEQKPDGMWFTTTNSIWFSEEIA